MEHFKCNNYDFGLMKQGEVPIKIKWIFSYFVTITRYQTGYSSIVIL